MVLTNNKDKIRERNNAKNMASKTIGTQINEKDHAPATGLNKHNLDNAKQ